VHSLVAIEPGSVNAIPIGVKRTEMVLRPDPSRVLLRPFTPGDLPRLQRIVNGIMAVPESDVGPLLDAVSSKFSTRHQQISKLFKERFELGLVVAQAGVLLRTSTSRWTAHCWNPGPA
jgi:hypothetical protein